MAGLTERLAERRAKRRAARDERRKRRAMDPRVGTTLHGKSSQAEVFRRHGLGRESGLRDYE
jgi:hypothetical protein